MVAIKSGWDRANPAIEREDLLDADGKPELALLSHPNYPLVAVISGRLADRDAELRAVANAYLALVLPLETPLGGPLARAAGLAAEAAEGGFGWLPITWDWAHDLKDPRGSFVVRRRAAGAQGAELDRSVVLVAANRIKKEPAASFAAQVALRVTMHLTWLAFPGVWAVRVTGLAAHGLRYAVDARHPLLARTLESFRSLANEVFRFRATRLTGLLPVDKTATVVLGSGQTGGDDESERSYAWSLPTRDAKAIALDCARRVELESAATAQLFLRDPASAGVWGRLAERRPTRDEEDLDVWREPSPLPARLQHPDQLFEVRRSRVADGPLNDPEEIQQVDPTHLPLRGDDLSAAHAYARARELFELMDELQLPAPEYFKFAQLPLVMRHRASFAARPDGNTVKGQVAVVGTEVSFVDSYKADERPRLEVRFGCAELQHRELRPNRRDGRDPVATAQPLGFAADPRWAWHEFGHVLSYAAGQALEFQFAHSAGDALAAVLADPRSRLARSAGDPLRGYTFPWVASARRHDRDADLGWCWCGRRNRMRRAPLRFPPLLYKGYVEEQMLSSSIFRLYRAIGGDTFDDEAVRRCAAHRCAYLLMRAIALCGPAALVPVRSAAFLAAALADADAGSRGRDYPAGCLHKVIRWAFERQGLYATGDPTRDVEGPGGPPRVDLWIRSRRDASGGYAPVPLAWGEHEQPWHADPQHGVRVRSRSVRVRIGNRGRQDSRPVRVRLWIAPARRGRLQWQPVAHVAVGPIAAGGYRSVRMRLPSAPPRRAFVLVECSCDGDRSNLDLQSRLPSAAVRPPAEPAALLDLVANDNNLALRWLRRA